MRPPSSLPGSTSTIPARNQRGFTLAEVLVAGVLGAILLTAVSHATYSFALTVAHLEDTSDQADDEDTVMRLMTRDIREAWWADIESPSHLKLLNDEGGYTEYYLQNGDVVKIRTDGSMDTLFEGVASLVFTGASDDRYREGPLTAMSGLWYDHGSTSYPLLPLALSVGNNLALGMTVPAMDSDLPTIVSSSSEEVTSTSLGSLSVPLAWVAGSTPQNLTISVYETRGPGEAAPRGSALGSVTVAGTSLPVAVASGSTWEIPSTNVTINLSNMGGALIPGAGYTLVFSAGGDAQLIVAAQPMLSSSTADKLAIKDAIPGSQYVETPLSVDFSVSGSHSLTSTTTTATYTSITVVLTPDYRPSQTRSASLLSQSLNESGWYGALEGETAP